MSGFLLFVGIILFMGAGFVDEYTTLFDFLRR